MSAKSNLDQLTEAHVIHADHLSQHDLAAINGLSAEEVSTLIKLREKMGAAPAGKDHLRPNFPV